MVGRIDWGRTLRKDNEGEERWGSGRKWVTLFLCPKWRGVRPAYRVVCLYLRLRVLLSLPVLLSLLSDDVDDDDDADDRDSEDGNSFIQAISIAPLQSSSPLHLRGAPDTARILCRSFAPKRHMQLRVKDLPNVSIYVGARRKATTLPMSHHTPQLWLEWSWCLIRLSLSASMIGPARERTLEGKGCGLSLWNRICKIVLGYRGLCCSTSYATKLNCVAYCIV